MGCYTPVAYVDGYNGAMLCPDHGTDHADEMTAEHGEDSETVPTPVMEWDEPLDILQTCDHDRHAFCGNCGAVDYFDVTTREHHGHMSSITYRCLNCRASARFLEDGRQFNRWAAGTGVWYEVNA